MLFVSLAPLTLLAVSLLVATHDSSAPSDYPHADRVDDHDYPSASTSGRGLSEMSERSCTARVMATYNTRAPR